MKINTQKLLELQGRNPDLYDICLVGVRAFLGENNQFSLSMTIPGGIEMCTASITMTEFLKDQGILMNEEKKLTPQVLSPELIKFLESVLEKINRADY